MVSITCYGGVGGWNWGKPKPKFYHPSIGGNKLIIQDGETTLSFDFGTSYAERGQYYEEFLNPRAAAGLLDPLFMRLIPPLGGIYRDDLLPDEALEGWLAGQEGYRELELAGVLLSHAHLDHSGYISFLRPDIPIYTTAMSAAIAKAIQDSAPGDFESEVCYARPREPRGGVLVSIRGQGRGRPFYLLEEKAAPPALQAFWSKCPTARFESEPCLEPFHGVASGLGLRHFPVDHSIFGACAIGVETSRGWVLHTGDLRLHGGESTVTRESIEKARELRPRVLLCEGTRIDRADRPGDRVTEENVRENALRAVQATKGKGLVIADFGPRNVERLLSFLEIARETGRKLAILPRDAYLLEAMRLVSDQVPDLATSEDILIYQNLRVQVSKWEKELRERHATKLISGAQAREEQNELILSFSFWDIANLIDIQPEKGSIYIYSTSEAYTEEQRIDLKRLRNWLDRLDVRLLGDPEAPGEERFHASGHASGPELLDMVREIRPQTLIPIHTEHPEIFAQELAGEGIEVRIPKYAQEIQL